MTITDDGQWMNGEVTNEWGKGVDTKYHYIYGQREPFRAILGVW